MIFKIAFLILLIYLFSTNKDCEELENLLYFSPSKDSLQQTEQQEDALPDMNQELSPDDVAHECLISR